MARSGSVGDPPDQPDWLRRLDRRAMLRESAGLTRRLHPHGPAFDDVVDLAGNDYLGLSRHPEVIAAAAKALHDYGLGATGSRLVRGSTDEHAMLESDVARLLGQPSALVYSSGYLANLAAIKAATPPGGRILIDAHAHASLHDGCRLSGAKTQTVPHADVDALGAALAALDGGPALVVTESVFSVDGDLAPLQAVHATCRAAGAVLLVDDAHALGLLGPQGEGAVFHAGLADEPDLIVTATLSKAVGAAGGVVAGPRILIRHLVETSRPFVYDTALPPSVAAGALAGIELLRCAGAERARANLHAALAALRLREAGLEVTEPAAAIVSVTAPDAPSAVEWAAACLRRGVAVGCFRPPSTPDARSRLRLTINAGVPTSDFEHALRVVIETAP